MAKVSRSAAIETAALDYMRKHTGKLLLDELPENSRKFYSNSWKPGVTKIQVKYLRDAYIKGYFGNDERTLEPLKRKGLVRRNPVSLKLELVDKEAVKEMLIKEVS